MNVAQARIKQWREDPVYFVRDQFRVEPDRWQVDALRAFADTTDPQKRRISLQACAGPGKTALLAWCGWNFLTCYANKGEHPNGAAVAITSDNLKDNLWKELAVWHGKSEFLRHAFTWTKERIFSKDHQKTWFLSARTWPKTADTEEQGHTLSGLHSKYILYLIDESGDIPIPILRSAEQGLTNCRWGKIMQAGNPTSQTGILYHAGVSQRAMWYVIRITGDPDDPNRSSRIDIDWAKQQILLYGRDNAWVMAYILGQFPSSAINALLSVEEMEAAMKRHLSEDKFDWSQKRLGIDAARFGFDPWVIFPRQGLAAFRPVVMMGPRSEEVAARVAKAKADWGSEMEFFDDTGGWAAGAIDAMIVAGHNPTPINFSGQATDPRYYNKRSEMLFKCADWIKRGAAMPNMPEIVREFTTPKYWFDKGKFRIEEKEQIVKRLGHSTNFFDALGLTFSIVDMPKSLGLPQGMMTSEQMKSYWDPFRKESD